MRRGGLAPDPVESTIGPVWLSVLVLGAVAAGGPGPREVSLTTADGGTVVADLYGEDGKPGVVLAHGAVFDKGSWRDLATRLAAGGRSVLAIDFRGYGRSSGGRTPEARFEDVLAAARELRRRGAARVALVGGSMGGGAAAAAVAHAAPGEVARLVLLSPAPIADPAALRMPTLFVLSVGEPAAGRIRTDYAAAPEPKRLLELPGDAHAQHVFATDQGAKLSAAIERFLAEP
jgi:pimeloyl-ACP methyl ester carboxylesterase